MTTRPTGPRRAPPRVATCQMFETPIIERLSRIRPTTPFFFWLPVLAYCLYRGIADGAGMVPTVGLVVLGVLFWTLTEYTLHRYVFHYMGPRPWQRRIYFVLHGVHHDYPQDAERLVMPLGVSVPIGIVFYLGFRMVLGDVLVNPAFVGFGLGYLGYDGAHYAVHHFRMGSRWGKWLKRYHMIHHHVGENARWGVSSPLWDWVFRTMGEKARAA